MAIQKLLVANRGEIAARIFRACREAGIGTVAVAAPDDLGAFHTRHADETVEIQSYLYSEEHIRAAQAAGADAIHPGYGFLAENADFAEAVEAAGLVFVGPTPEALRRGGDKLEAKRIAAEAGVPTLPAGEPDEIGFPLVVKAAAGGGGRGMRVVRDPAELEDAIEAARREAKAAFGDDRVYCERFVERPRHVEIQLLADGHGTVLSLGERECSIQRRHQKVLEESPSPALDRELRERMSDAAVAFGRALGYRSAGTVEFMLDGRDFYLLELNGRIQVEHPVTELVTGVDIVREQLRIADGETLQHSVTRSEGHAVEVRLYAEDPRTFLPQAGRIERLRLPTGIRVDAGRRRGRRGGRRLRPDDREADRPRPEPRRGALQASRRARGDRRRRPDDEPPVPALARRAPCSSAPGRTTTAFLSEYAPLSAPPARLPSGPWDGAWRMNLPPPAPHTPPDVDELSHAAAGPSGGAESALTAPMPGTVIKVLAAPGDKVEQRQTLLVLEAMKMETPVVSPYAATVKAVHVAEGDRVAGGAVLVELDE